MCGKDDRKFKKCEELIYIKITGKFEEKKDNYLKRSFFGFFARPKNSCHKTYKKKFGAFCQFSLFDSLLKPFCGLTVRHIFKNSRWLPKSLFFGLNVYFILKINLFSIKIDSMKTQIKSNFNCLNLKNSIT